MLDSPFWGGFLGGVVGLFTCCFGLGLAQFLINRRVMAQRHKRAQAAVDQVNAQIQQAILRQAAQATYSPNEN